MELILGRADLWVKGRANPHFSPRRAAQEQGISARRRSTLLRGLNNAVYELLCAAFGEKHQTGFFNIFKNRLYL
ncbi:MAG: hypothetical protein DRH24_17840 [Deltaproteobacteria bacterium]|nr:MAG: hypothetical protein DRH24_17840 [Deltaproteobacteria bacterium]